MSAVISVFIEFNSSFDMFFLLEILFISFSRYICNLLLALDENEETVISTVFSNTLALKKQQHVT